MKPAIVVTILGIVGTVTYLFMKSSVKKSPNKSVAPPLIIDLEKPLEPVKPVNSFTEIPLTTDSAPIPPYNKLGFGIDSHRNTDEHEIDDYLNLPLVGEGKTYLNSSLAEVDELTSAPVIPSTKYKYIRLHVLETRDNSPTVSLGQITFYKGADQIKESQISIWNPHTGITEPYKGSWTDSDMKTIIFCFTELEQITHYVMKTSSKPPMHDPSMWDLEGSKNGSYWSPIHSVDEELPVLRGKTMYFRIN